MHRLASLVLFEFCMLALSAFAQHEGHESVGRVPREILERPVPLRQGIGKVHEEVTTSSPKAQGAPTRNRPGHERLSPRRASTWPAGARATSGGRNGVSNR